MKPQYRYVAICGFRTNRLYRYRQHNLEHADTHLYILSLAMKDEVDVGKTKYGKTWRSLKGRP